MRPVTGLRMLLASALALGASACATTPSLPWAEDEQSAYGAFLAARYAGQNRDFAASSALYADALAQAPTSELLSQRAFFAALLAGEFERADSVVGTAVQDPDTAQIAMLYWQAINLGQGERPRPDPSPVVYGPFAALVQEILRDWDAVARGRSTRADVANFHLRTTDPVDPHKLIHRALLLDQARQFDEAKAAYQGALQVAPELSLFAAELYGAFLERQGRRQDARRLYERTLSAAPDSAQLQTALERVNTRGRAPRHLSPQQAAARALYTPALIISSQAALEYTVMYLRVVQRLDPDFHANTLSIAGLLENLDMDAQALAALRSIEDGPLRNRVLLNRIWLEYRLTEDAALIDEARAHTALVQTLQAKLLLADLLRFSGQCVEAIGWYSDVMAQAAAQGDPVDWRHVFYSGVCTEIEQGWAVAAPLFEQALSLAPNEPLLLNHVGYNLIVEGEQLDRGFRLVERAATLEPNNGAILDSLGWGHFKQGRFDQAVLWLERSVTLSPDSATINWHLGDAYAALGRTLEAQFQWRRALELELDPGEEDLIRRRLELGLDAGPADLS